MESPDNALNTNRTLPSLSNYTITEQGIVYSHITRKNLKGLTKSDNYCMVFLKMDNGLSKWFYVHRLVATIYVPNPNNKPEVDHEDNDKANNHKNNLKWVTHAENIQLSFQRGRKTSKGQASKRKGTTHNTTTKQLMSDAKQGTKHPKFKGYYIYEGNEYTSLNALAIANNTNPTQAKRMFNKGLITFRPK